MPLSALERIEVLKDGASAIYGSDAIGGVINFICAKDYKKASSPCMAVARRTAAAPPRHKWLGRFRRHGRRPFQCHLGRQPSGRQLAVRTGSTVLPTPRSTKVRSTTRHRAAPSGQHSGRRRQFRYAQSVGAEQLLAVCHESAVPLLTLPV
ncbi:MAG: TonB-dependent receptor plug domain-containing protein [Sterolibacteriaceae bacterium]|nr:TonB-dependent receptor plug domain-containing protein [Candidatus Methylophosphatis haderslevensis]